MARRKFDPHVPAPDALEPAAAQPDVWVGRRPGTPYPICRRAGKAFDVNGTWFTRAEWEAIPDADRKAVESDPELVVRDGRRGDPWPIVTVTLVDVHPTPTHRPNLLQGRKPGLHARRMAGDARRGPQGHPGQPHADRVRQ